jgi:hypothetical protein
MIRAGLARALKLFVGVAAASGAVALAVALATGTGLTRALSLGWTCAGAFVLLLGFVASSRGPTRADDSGGWVPVSLTARSLRWASRSEQEESIALAATLVLLGLFLIALGLAVDPRHPLF